MQHNKLQMEIWKQVEDYENYEISNFGRIKNKETKTILKQITNKQNGYLYVGLCKKGKRKNKTIHRLVAYAFCENPNNKSMVDHKDNNKLNNHYTNLRFCTDSENKQNVKVKANNTSGCTGVSFAKRENKWLARINRTYIGLYKTFEEAKQARLQKEKELFKEFSPN